MTPIATSTPAVAATQAAALEPVAAFNPTDLEKLRALIQSAAAQTANPVGVTPIEGALLDGATNVTTRSLGDSILESVLRFGNNYQSSMASIETRLQEVVRTESAGLSNFSDILALQIDVAKWSMSVMGVDNASKAGSNTIKELSRGG
jgi:hypothetical protein